MSATQYVPLFSCPFLHECGPRPLSAQLVLFALVFPSWGENCYSHCGSRTHSFHLKFKFSPRKGALVSTFFYDWRDFSLHWSPRGRSLPLSSISFFIAGHSMPVYFCWVWPEAFNILWFFQSRFVQVGRVRKRSGRNTEKKKGWSKSRTNKLKNAKYHKRANFCGLHGSIVNEVELPWQRYTNLLPMMLYYGTCDLAMYMRTVCRCFIYMGCYLR